MTGAALQSWVDRQHAHCARAVLRSISPTELVKHRPGFGQSVRGRRGAIVASPVLADWDPEPDYFFHWFRDSAVVIEALRRLFEAGRLGSEAVGHLAAFVDFSLELEGLDGAALAASADWRAAVKPEFAKFVRSNAELERVRGSSVVAETRVNADGSIDISSWARPQHDGAPSRVLALLRWAPHVAGDRQLIERLTRLVRADLEFTQARWREPSYDIWEEEQALHYYTLCVSGAALRRGAQWLQSLGETATASRHLEAAAQIDTLLDGFWMPQEGYYRSRQLASGERSPKELDIAVVLAAVHANEPGERHSPADPRIHATLGRLEALFGRLYAINSARPEERAPAMGRYEGDRYFSGGAYYFSTLGAAELCYLAAARCTDAAGWFQRGEAFVETVRAFTPADGELSEQFDQRTGAQTSARQLAWSYAAFISCVSAREAARTALAREAR